MNIVVLSGKGGTGKTTITSALAYSLSRKSSIMLVDADADCPNQHILFPGKQITKKPLYISKVAHCNLSKCSSCERCVDICQFGAISMQGGKPRVDETACEGCGACVVGCPRGAFELVPKLTGELLAKEVSGFPLIYARLLPGESGSGRIVFEAKREAGLFAKRYNITHTIVDAPAGIGCPVISAVSGCDLAIGVVEPTPASITNLQRALAVTGHFKIPHRIVINKSGLSKKYEKRINGLFGEAALGAVPYDSSVPVQLARGTLPLHGKGEAAESLREICVKLGEIVSAHAKP